MILYNCFLFHCAVGRSLNCFLIHCLAAGSFPLVLSQICFALLASDPHSLPHFIPSVIIKTAFTSVLAGGSSSLLLSLTLNNLFCTALTAPSTFALFLILYLQLTTACLYTTCYIKRSLEAESFHFSLSPCLCLDRLPLSPSSLLFLLFLSYRKWAPFTIGWHSA